MNIDGLKTELEKKILGKEMGPFMSGIFKKCIAVEIVPPGYHHRKDPLIWRAKMQEIGSDRFFMASIEEWLTEDEIESLFAKYSMRD